MQPLRQKPWLLGDRFSAVDMLCSSPVHWFTEMTPDDPAVRDWVERCAGMMGEAMF